MSNEDENKTKRLSEILYEHAIRHGLAAVRIETEIVDPQDFMGLPDTMQHEYAPVMLPTWAIGATPGKPCLGAHLATKDGRRMGNAHIIHIRQASWDPEVTLYVVLTDAGNLIVLTAGELAGAFYPPEFISDLWDVVKKFWRNDISYAAWLQQQQ